MLARKLIGFPNTLDTPGSVIRLLAIVVPASSLVSCTIAVSAWRTGSGAMPAE